MPNVLQIMNFSAAYGGNFICSMLALEKAVADAGGVTVFMFPERARSRDWMQTLLNEEKIIFFQPDNPITSAFLIKRIIKEYDIKIVHSHFISSRSYIPLRIACIRKSITHIFHAHSMPKHNKRPFVDFFRRRLINASLVVAVSDAVSAEYSKLGFKTTAITNGIDFSRLDSYEKLPRSTMSQLPDSVILLMFGYNVNIKGIDTAVSSLLEYDTERRFSLCVCVASNTEAVENELRSIVGDNAPWLRLLPPRSDVASYYKSADIFVSASRFEGLPYAVCESAYSGLPLILSDIPAHRELSVPGAVLFRTDDKKDFFDALFRCADKDEELCANQCAEAKDFVEDSFSMSRWTDDILNIYRQF